MYVCYYHYTFIFFHTSQGSVKTRLPCGEIYNIYVIANCQQSVPVNKFWKSIIGEDMDKSKVSRFCEPPCCCLYKNCLFLRLRDVR